MSAKRLRWIALSGLVLMALVLTMGFVFLRFSRITAQFPLPDRQAAPAPGAGEEPAGKGETVAVTRENVQAVVASLERPKAYSRTIQVDLYYGPSGSASFTIRSAVGEKTVLTAVTGPGGQRYVLSSGGSRYIWYEGDKEYFTAEGGSADEDQMILTYEDVVDLDPEAILEAGVERRDGGLGIAVEFISGQLGYRTRCFISVANGLLLEAEQYDGDRLVYRMRTLDLDLNAPEESLFTLPDGSSPV